MKSRPLQGEQRNGLANKAHLHGFLHHNAVAASCGGGYIGAFMRWILSIIHAMRRQDHKEDEEQAEKPMFDCG